MQASAQAKRQVGWTRSTTNGWTPSAVAWQEPFFLCDAHAVNGPCASEARNVPGRPSVVVRLGLRPSVAKEGAASVAGL